MERITTRKRYRPALYKHCYNYNYVKPLSTARPKFNQNHTGILHHLSVNNGELGRMHGIG